MKILYAIQGTGNGHLARAREIVPILQQKGTIDLLVSGIQADIEFPFALAYRFQGLSFIFGKKGGVDLMETYKRSNLQRLLSEINSLPVEDYDLVISDFEPVSSWACYLKGRACISLSHQAAVLNKNAPQPRHSDLIGSGLLKYYAPCTSSYGFHFQAYDKNIYPPVIRREVRELNPENKGHYTVYLPAYEDKRIISILAECKGARWQVFSKHNKRFVMEKNVSVYPVSNDAFLNSMAGSAGVFCGAGFETPAEAMFLGKKLMVIPMKNQYEQHCNAAALKTMGVPVLKHLKMKHVDKIKTWIKSGPALAVNYPDMTSRIIDDLISTQALSGSGTIDLQQIDHSIKELRKSGLKKILAYMAR